MRYVFRQHEKVPAPNAEMLEITSAVGVDSLEELERLQIIVVSVKHRRAVIVAIVVGDHEEVHAGDMEMFPIVCAKRVDFLE